MTFNIKTLSITTRRTITLHNGTQHYGTQYSVDRLSAIYDVFMLGVANKPFMLNIVMQNVAILSVVMLNAAAPLKYFAKSGV